MQMLQILLKAESALLDILMTQNRLANATSTGKITTHLNIAHVSGSRNFILGVMWHTDSKLTPCIGSAYYCLTPLDVHSKCNFTESFLRWRCERFTDLECIYHPRIFQFWKCLDGHFQYSELEKCWCILQLFSRKKKLESPRLPNLRKNDQHT